MSKTFSASKISASEWEVMDIVWDKHPITAPEVFALLGKDQNWSQKTVNTFLARLAEKEALAVEKRYNMNFYSPLVSREESVARESRSFLSRFFQGVRGPRGRVLILDILSSGGARTNLADGMGAPTSALASLQWRPRRTSVFCSPSAEHSSPRRQKCCLHGFCGKRQRYPKR
jgi:BlaI family penicillinase repressor